MYRMPGFITQNVINLPSGLFGGMTESPPAAVPTELSIEVPACVPGSRSWEPDRGLLPSATGLPVQAGDGLFSMWWNITCKRFSLIRAALLSLLTDS